MIARLFLFWYNLNVVKVADLAQLVERFPRKEKVASSILAISIQKNKIGKITLIYQHFMKIGQGYFLFIKDNYAHDTEHVFTCVPDKNF